MENLKVKKFYNYSNVDGSYIDSEDIRQDVWILRIEGREYYANPAFSTDIEPLVAKEGFKVCFNTNKNIWEYKKIQDREEYSEQKEKLFSKEEISIMQSYSEYLDYLFATDWYISRFTETGETIPEDVKAKRMEARLKISELRPLVEKIKNKQ